MCICTVVYGSLLFELDKVGNLFEVVALQIGKPSFAPEFQCYYFCESSCLFYLSFNFDFYVS